MAEADTRPHRHRRRRRRRPRGVPGAALVPRRSRAEHRPAVPRAPLRVPPADRARALRRRARRGAWSSSASPPTRTCGSCATRSPRSSPTGTSPSPRTPVASPTTRCSSASAPGRSARSRGRSPSVAAATPLPSAPRSTPLQPGDHGTIAFAVPFGAFWTLPLYELAILAAAQLRARGARAQIVMTSPEAAPLEAFGAAASTAVAQLLDARGDRVHRRASRAIAADAGELELDDGRRIQARAVVTLPDLVGRRVPGLRQDAAGLRRRGRPRAGARAPTASTPPATSPPSRSSRAAWPPSRPTPPPRPCSPRSACPSSRARSSRSSRASSTPSARRSTFARRRTARVRRRARTRCGGRRARSPGATWRPTWRPAPERRARPRCGPSATPSR